MRSLMSFFKIVFPDCCLESAITAKPTFHAEAVIHHPADVHKVFSRPTETQQPFKHIARKVCRQERRQYGRPADAQRSSCPPNMQTFVRRLLSSRTLTGALHADGRRRQPFFDQ
jgi:hypothetical protein